MCEVPICGRTKSSLAFHHLVETKKKGKKKNSYMYKTKQKQKKFFTFELVVMVGSATNRLCQFWQYACVYECVNVHLET